MKSGNNAKKLRSGVVVYAKETRGPEPTITLREARRIIRKHLAEINRADRSVYTLAAGRERMASQRYAITALLREFGGRA